MCDSSIYEINNMQERRIKGAIPEMLRSTLNKPMSNIAGSGRKCPPNFD